MPVVNVEGNLLVIGVAIVANHFLDDRNFVTLPAGVVVLSVYKGLEGVVEVENDEEIVPVNSVFMQITEEETV